MKLKYLGTAAAEGIPALFCDCENCKRSRALGGRNIRTRSQAIINDELLIDFCADTYYHFIMHNLPMTKLRSCLVTHSHGDHLYPSDFEMRRDKCFAHLDENVGFTVYADRSAHDAIDEMIKRCNLTDETIVNKRIYPFVPFETAEGYRVTPLRASHAPASTPVVYIIERDGKTLLYFHDSSELPEESLAYLKEWGGHIDLVSSDCTSGTKNSTYMGHLDLGRNIRMRDEFNVMGITDESTVWCLNHFSHNGGIVVYDEFSKIAEEQGFLTSYDGFEIEF